MPTRNLVLTDHLEEFIGEQVESGRYRNASEVMREALRVMERKEAMELAKIEALRANLLEGEKDVALGHFDEYTPTLLEEIDEEEKAEHQAGR